MVLDIHEMQIFLTAAETGSFSEAGRRLQMSQPAVSMQIRSLEKRLNVELFHRSGRHITLTEVGHTLIPLARDLVNHSINVHETIASLQGEVIGHLKIACSTTAGKYILPKLFAKFIERHPAVQVTCDVNSRIPSLDMLLEGQAQLAVTSLKEFSRELEYRPFMLDPVILIAPAKHIWARAGSIQINDLYRSRFIHRELTSGTMQTVAEALAERNMSLSDLPCVMTLGNSEAIHLAVSEGIGVAFISRSAAAEGIAAGRVAEINIEGLKMAQQLYLVRLANSVLASAPAAFWEFVYEPENQRLLAPTKVAEESLL